MDDIPQAIIRQIIQNNEIENAKPFNLGISTKFSLYQGEYQGSEVVLKIIPVTEEARIKKYLNEKKATDLMSREIPEFRITNILAAGNFSDYFWIIRKFWKGEPLAPYFSKKTCLYGYDEIDSQFLSLKNTIINQIGDFINSVQNININAENEEYPVRRFQQDIANCHLGWQSRGFSLNMYPIIEYYNRIAPTYFDNNNLSFSINDMVPPNIFMGEDKQLIFSDFEWFGIDHVYTDRVFVWLYFWRHPDWQEAWFQKAFGPNINQDYFRVAVIRHVLNWCSNLYNPELKITNNLLEERKEYSQHIWLRYLVAAGESFEALMRVK